MSAENYSGRCFCGEVEFEVVGGLVRVSTRDDLNQTSTVTRVYDISDVVMRETRRPRMMGGMMGGGMMGQGGMMMM